MIKSDKKSESSVIANQYSDSTKILVTCNYQVISYSSPNINK